MNWFDPISNILGSFNSFLFDRVRNISLTFEFDPMKLQIDIFVTYGTKHCVLIRMYNAKQVRIQEMNSPLLQFGEVFVESLAENELEELRYYFHDELGSLSAFCEKLQIIKIVEINNQGLEKSIWELPSHE